MSVWDGYILAVTFDEKYESKYNEAEMTMASSNLPHQSWITNIGMTKSSTVIPVHNVKAIKTEKIVAKTKQYRANQQDINSTSKVDEDIGKESINEQTVEDDLTGGINFNITTLLIDREVIVDQVKRKYAQIALGSQSISDLTDLVKDVFDAICQSKSVKMKCSTSILDSVRCWTVEIINQIRKGITNQEIRKGGSLVQICKMEVSADAFVKADDYKRVCMEWERYDLETQVGLAKQRMKEKQMNKQHLPDETKEVEEDRLENVSGRHLCERAGNSVAFSLPSLCLACIRFSFYNTHNK